MKFISILGSTGSIGRQTLEVIKAMGDAVQVKALTGHSNVELLISQALEFQPEVVACSEPGSYCKLKAALSGKVNSVLAGVEGVEAAASLNGLDLVVSAIVGVAGLLPSLTAIRAGKDLALANKETLVAAGHIVMREAAEFGVSILPVDSEHSAIFQCLQGQPNGAMRGILLTASGGPFRNYSINELKEVSPEQALRHPNWNMGKKITIDCATLMNKGLEVIEAKWLFGLDYDNIDVYIHPTSTIHSMIELVDGSILAQLGVADMRLPIQYALSYPKRVQSICNRLDLTHFRSLEFYRPDLERFPVLMLAYEAGRKGGIYPTVLNSANEIAVSLFLDGKIGFMDIPKIVSRVMELSPTVSDPSLDDILGADQWARELVLDYVGK